MSAIPSNSDDRDLDPIRRAQRAHEPSMEEILASIRNMIADDPAKAAAPNPSEPAPSPAPQAVHSKDAGASPGEPSEPNEREGAGAPTVVWRRPRAVEAEPDAEPGGADEAPLLSPEANEAAALSFGALSASLEVRSAELADELVRETLRPMLKQWLDENLPSIVERLVRAEILRIARGSR